MSQTTRDRIRQEAFDFAQKCEAVPPAQWVVFHALCFELVDPLVDEVADDVMCGMYGRNEIMRDVAEKQSDVARVIRMDLSRQAFGDGRLLTEDLRCKLDCYAALIHERFTERVAQLIEEHM